MMTTSKTMLTESIVHLEDLDLPAFIAAVRNMAKMQATEKLDGSNLWFGLDDSGALYTSRAGKRKSAENMYAESDYPFFAAYNGFRSAHAALKSKEVDIKKVLRPGDTIEIEVLYGRQPNAVVYGAGGKNYIAFLRGVNGTPEVMVDQLATMLNGTSTTVRVQIVDSVDGENLTLTPADVQFQFVGVQKIDTQHLKSADVSKHLAALEKFLQAKAPLEGVNVTNFELLTSSLASFDKDVRPAAKALRSQTQAKVLTDFKLPIKKELLDKFVSNVKSPLAADDLTSDEDIGIEGVVLRDPESDDQIKIVDKDTFTTINQFNHAVRYGISGTIKSTDSAASLESRGGIVGEMKILVADLLGNRDLARSQAAKKVFATFKGKTPEDTVRNVAKELRGGDDYLSTKRKVLALIDATKEKLSASLKDFKANKDNFRLKLKSGKAIGLSAEIIRRTLLAYAEAKRDLDELHAKVKKSKNLPQLVAIFYGRAAKAVHETEPDAVTEQLLIERRQFTDKAQYANKDGWTLLNIYFATLMMAAVIYKADDKPGIRLLRDKTHYRLTKWTKEMSAVNFWGYPIWKSGTPAVKKLIGKKIAAEIFRHSRKVPSNHWLYLHMDLSFGKDVPIEWADHLKSLRTLQHFPAMNVDRVNILLKGVFDYDTLTLDEKVKLHNRLYFYIMQFIPTSPLLTRFRAIQNNLLVNATGENELMVQEMKLLQSVTEEGEGAATTASATTSTSIAPIETRLAVGNKQVIKRQRNNGWMKVDSKQRWKYTPKDTK